MQNWGRGGRRSGEEYKKDVQDAGADPVTVIFEIYLLINIIFLAGIGVGTCTLASLICCVSMSLFPCTLVLSCNYCLSRYLCLRSCRCLCLCSCLCLYNFYSSLYFFHLYYSFCLQYFICYFYYLFFPHLVSLLLDPYLHKSCTG